MSAAPRCFCGQPDGAASHVLASHPQFHAIEAASFAASPPSPPSPPAEQAPPTLCWNCGEPLSSHWDDKHCSNHDGTRCLTEKFIPAAPLRSPACICASWCANIGKVDAPFSLLAARNPDSYHGYDGEVFRFCPWCGTGLTTSATDSLAGASVLTPSVDYLEYQFQLTPEQADMLAATSESALASSQQEVARLREANAAHRSAAGFALNALTTIADILCADETMANWIKKVREKMEHAAALTETTPLAAARSPLSAPQQEKT